MNAISSAEAQRLLGQLARGRALIALDFDGTLAPIVPDRTAAGLREETRRLLRALALLYPCAIISGRARADVAARVSGIPLVAIIGNHGAEAGRGPLDRSLRAQILAWRRVLEAALGDELGLALEDKCFSIAVHYRQAPSPARARRAIFQVARSLEGARVFGGHAVVNVVPALAPNKGTALAEVLGRVGPRPVAYIGDDKTDEDAFRAKCVTAGIRVGRTARSAASWYVLDQMAVDELLCALIEARAHVDGRGATASGLAQAVGV